MRPKLPHDGGEKLIMFEDLDPNDDIVRSPYKRPLKKIVESGDLGLRGVVAYDCFVALGFSPTPQWLRRSILAEIRYASGDQSVEFTDEYFFEEVIFLFHLAMELEARLQYISFLASKGLSKWESLAREHGIDISEMNAVGVLSTMNHLAHSLYLERCFCAGVRALLDESAFVDAMKQRATEYLPLITDHLRATTLEPLENWTMGFSPRRQLFQLYLGAVADNLMRSLGLKSGFTVVVVETVIWKFNIDQSRWASMDMKGSFNN